jgi:hypothetical protein
MYHQEIVRKFLYIQTTEVTRNCCVSHHSEYRQLAGPLVRFARRCTRNYAV